MSSDEKQVSLFALQDLPTDDIQKQQLTPAVVQQRHLVTHLTQIKQKD